MRSESMIGLGVEPTLEMCLGDLVDPTHERCHPHGNVSFIGESKGAVKGRGNDALQATLDIGCTPKKPLKVLHPFKV